MNRQVQIEFEVLVGKFLCGDASGADQSRLKELTGSHPELAARLDKIAGLDQLLRKVAPSAPEPEVEVSPTDKVIPLKKKTTYNWHIRSIAAGIIIVFGIAVALFITLPGNGDRSGYIANNGTCIREGRSLAKGNPVPLYETIEAEKGHICEILYEGERRIRVRIQETGGLLLDRDSTGSIVVRKKGGLTVDSEGPTSARSIAVISGESRIVLLGTRVMVRGGEKGVQLEILKGKVSVSRSPANLLYGKKNVNVEQAREKLNSVGYVEEVMELKSGEGVQLAVTEGHSQQTEQLVQWLTRDPEKSQDLPPEVESRIKEKPPARAIYTLNREELESREAFFKGDTTPDIIIIEKQDPPLEKKPSAGAATPHNAQKVDSFGFRQTVVTTDGKSYTGVLKEEKNSYRIYTNSGMVRIPRSKVKSISFSSE